MIAEHKKDRATDNEKALRPWQAWLIVGLLIGIGSIISLLSPMEGKFWKKGSANVSAIWLEAERGILTSPMLTANDPNASQNEFVWVPNGAGIKGKTNFSFTISQAGTYKIWGRILAPNDTDNSFYVQIDGGSLKQWGMSPANRWRWDEVSDYASGSLVDPVVFDLATGMHTLTVIQREDGTKIDKILITSNLTYTPIEEGEPVSQTTPVHPNLFFNQREIDDIKTKINQKREPWMGSFSRMKAGEDNYTAAPDVYDGTDVNQYLAKFEQKDAPHAARNALLYVLTNDKKYANRAKEFLVAWASGSLHQINSHDDFADVPPQKRYNAGLRLSNGFINFSNVYDLIYNADILSPEDHIVIQSWLRKGHQLIKESVSYWIQNVSCHTYSNHQTAHIAGLAVIGFVLNDPQLFNEAIEGTTIPINWKTLMSKAIYMRGEPSAGCDKNPTFEGEVFDRYRHYDAPGSDPWANLNRGYGYSLFSTSRLTAVAEAALHNGIDLYQYRAPQGEQLLLPGVYYSYYLNKFSPTPQLIKTTGYEGENGYIDEVTGIGHYSAFEILAYRYHNHSLVTRAFDNALPTERTYQRDTPEFFGKIFDKKETGWYFHLNNIMEEWSANNADRVKNLDVKDGLLSFVTTHDDAWIETLKISVQTKEFSTLVVRMKLSNGVNAGNTLPAQLFWAEGNNAFSSENKATFLALVDNTYRTYTLNLKTNTAWKGVVNKLRFDPVNTSGITVHIDSIVLQNPNTS
ncbi:MAG: alginate lyase family protein [Candidatus Sungbacteria bacterium]|nr:alginate lyase family protein [Candidatus Sungbacteria bacterium]